GSVAHMEVTACASLRSATLLVASMASRRGQWITFLYRSTDGGMHWTQVLETTAPGMWGDPTCAFDADERAYYAGLWARFGAPATRGVRSMHTWVRTSGDGGKTWRPPAVQMAIDRPFLAIDNERRAIYYSALWASESLTGRDPNKEDLNDTNVETA